MTIAARTSTATIAEALRTAVRALAAAGVDSPMRDARLLLGEALGLSLEQLVTQPRMRLDGAARTRFGASLARRASREPLSQILRRREFWSLPFIVTADTLTPRPESETVVAAALGSIDDRQRALRVLDLGTGTGCLLLALLHELPGARGIGVEVSVAAARVARANARELGLAERASIVVGDWAAAIAGRFDLVVANPPYIPDREIEMLAPEVARYEPRRALRGGGDGLAAYRRICPDMRRLIADGGRAIIEVGAGQAEEVAEILENSGFAPPLRRRDLLAVERCLVVSPVSG